MASDNKMLQEYSWAEFRDCGLLWWVNRVLHLFGWAIVCEIEDDDGSINRVYPARCRFRGFDAKSEGDGFAKLTKYLHDESSRLLADTELEAPPDARDGPSVERNGPPCPKCQKPSVIQTGDFRCPECGYSWWQSW